MNCDDYVGYKILLNPTEDQKKKFNEYFGVVRYIYNWGIDQIEEYYKDSKLEKNKYCILSYEDLTTRLTNLKHQESTKWLNDYNRYSLTNMLKTLRTAYDNWFKGVSKKPKYKSKKITNMSFPIRHERLHIYSDKVYIPSIKYVNTIGNIPSNIIGYGDKCAKATGSLKGLKYIHYTNARIIFDGHKYYLTFSVDRDEDHQPASCKRYKYNEVWKNRLSSDVIGIDVGCGYHNWFVLSNGMRFDRPNQTKLDRRLEGYQQEFSRKLESLYEDLDRKGIDRTRAKYYYSNSMYKTLEKINKIEKKITNRKKNAAREIANYLLRLKPEAVVFEDFKIRDWYVDDDDDIDVIMPYFVRQRINKTIKDSMLYTAREIIVRILGANDIPVIYADKEYPSTQLCSNCGSMNKISLHQKIYKCEYCGLVINRDDNAAINLQHYGENLIYSNIHTNVA